jgi:hypothetical protein
VVQTVGDAIGGLRRGNQKPLPINFTKVVNYVTRYTMGSQANAGITINDILDSYFVAASSTVGFRVFSAVKIRKIEIWGPAYTGASPVTLNFTWYSEASGQDTGSPSVNVTDTSVAFNDCPHLCVVPPRNSNAAMWLSSQNNSDPLFYMVAPANSVVDIHLTGTIAEGAPGGAVGQAAIVRSLSGATPGTLYSSYMNPSAGATGLTPVMGNVI